MDISFTCDKCGKNLAIDDAAAGITIDCPECGKAVYVPSSVPPPQPKEPTVRATAGGRGRNHCSAFPSISAFGR